MADSTYTVIAGGLVAKMKSDTGEGYLYRGDIVPAGVPASEVARLEELGLIAKVDFGDPVAPATKAQK